MMPSCGVSFRPTDSAYALRPAWPKVVHASS
jgi:hypothetical protein